MEYWTWWQGALALGGLTVGFVYMIGRMLGVSGSWNTLVNWREQHGRRQVAETIQSNAAAMNNALMAATLAEFGETRTHQLLATQGTPVAQPGGRAAPVTIRCSAHLLFLLFMVVGGLLASVASGRFALHLDLGATHMRLFGTGISEWLALLGGGMLVGFGTQMGGGCTSGHGLSGVSRFTPASLIATMAFFGSAVVASFLLEVLKS